MHASWHPPLCWYYTVYKDFLLPLLFLDLDFLLVTSVPALLFPTPNALLVGFLLRPESNDWKGGKVNI